MYNRGLFHKWVPQPVVVLLIMLFVLLFLIVNPIYLGNIMPMVGSTGVMAEYFTLASFACIIGMGLVLPVMMRFKARFRPKALMIASTFIMVILSVVTATTNNGTVIVGASLLFGIAKMFCMTTVILPFMRMVSPKGDRKRFYSILYPMALIVTQLGSFAFSAIALDISWQAAHFYTAIILLFAILLFVVFMHNQRSEKMVPLYYMDWLGIILFASALMSFAFVCTFGKQQDWFVSHKIIIGTITAIVSTAILVIRQLKIKHPILSFRLYRRGDVLTGIILFVGQGMFMSVASIQSIYTSGILGYNWLTNSALNLMMLPGISIAGFIAVLWVKRKLSIKIYILTGFAAYFLYTVMLYFMMIPGLNIESFYLPQILNGYGMCALFISIWAYTLVNLPQETVLPSVAPVMLFRSFILTAFFSALYGWVQYKLQWQSVGNLAYYFDTLSINYNQVVGSLRDIQMSAVLASNKTLLGYIVIAGLGFLTFVLLHPFGRQKYWIAEAHAYKSEKQNRPVLDKKITDMAGSI